MMKKKFSLFVLIPTIAVANAPDFITLSLELGFLAVLIVLLIKASFSIEKKALLFALYISLGILTKTIWLPVILTAGLFWYFHKSEHSNNE